MSTTEQSITNGELNQLGLARSTRMIPRPTVLKDTGLTETFVADLTAKHLLDKGSMTLGQLSRDLAITGSIAEGVLDFMRTEARIEVRPGHGRDSSLSYTLTERGRVGAMDAMLQQRARETARLLSQATLQIVRGEMTDVTGPITIARPSTVRLRANNPLLFQRPGVAPFHHIFRLAPRTHSSSVGARLQLWVRLLRTTSID